MKLSVIKEFKMYDDGKEGPLSRKHYYGDYSPNKCSKVLKNMQ